MTVQPQGLRYLSIEVSFRLRSQIDAICLFHRPSLRSSQTQIICIPPALPGAVALWKVASFPFPRSRFLKFACI